MGARLRSLGCDAVDAAVDAVDEALYDASRGEADQGHGGAEEQHLSHLISPWVTPYLRQEVIPATVVAEAADDAQNPFEHGALLRTSCRPRWPARERRRVRRTRLNRPSGWRRWRPRTRSWRPRTSSGGYKS